MPGQRRRRRQFILIFAATFPSGQAPDVSGRLLNLLCASFPQGKPFVVGTAQVYYSGYGAKNQEGGAVRAGGRTVLPRGRPCREVKRSAAQSGLPGHFWTAAEKEGQDGGGGQAGRAAPPGPPAADAFRPPGARLFIATGTRLWYTQIEKFSVKGEQKNDKRQNGRAQCRPRKL